MGVPNIFSLSFSGICDEEEAGRPDGSQKSDGGRARPLEPGPKLRLARFLLIGGQ